MKIYLNLIVFLFPLLLNGQTGYSEGYIITYENDTIYGKIKDRAGSLSSSNYLKIRFMNDEGEIEKFSAYDIRGYSKSGLINYRAIEIESKYFAEVIEDGPLTLLANDKKQYELQTNTGTNGDFTNSTTTTNVYSHYYLQKKGSDKVTEVTKWNFKKKMSQYFMDYPELKEQIDNKSLRFNDLKLIVKKYNKNIESGDL